jgi:hypothetical protein
VAGGYTSGQMTERDSLTLCAITNASFWRLSFRSYPNHLLQPKQAVPPPVQRLVTKRVNPLQAFQRNYLLAGFDIITRLTPSELYPIGQLFSTTSYPRAFMHNSRVSVSAFA